LFAAGNLNILERRRPHPLERDAGPVSAVLEEGTHWFGIRGIAHWFKTGGIGYAFRGCCGGGVKSREDG
jgi:hypothetical protein